jgi:hypothetical protein
MIRTLVPNRVGQRKDKMRHLCGSDEINLPSSSSKLVYMRHHRFLPCKHKYRQWRTQFDGTIENEEAPKHRDGKFVFEMIKNIKVIFGKPVK